MVEFRVWQWASCTETFDFFCLTRVVGEVLISYANFRSFETYGSGLGPLRSGQLIAR